MARKLARFPPMQRLYRGAVRIVHRLPLRGVLAESVAGRRGAAARWRRWAAEHRGSGALVWLHAASVGETQAAVPVLARLRAARPELRTVLTYSSPSMARWPQAWPVDRADYVPLDEPPPVAAVLDALRPAVLCFSRGDLWPELVRSAHCRGVTMTVMGATVRPQSRLGILTRRALRSTYRAITHVGAATDDDAERWAALGVAHDRVRVTGDPRHDWVLEREVALAPARALTDWRDGRAVLVAGSLEREDVHPLTQGVSLARATSPALRVLAVPHDPALAARVTRAARAAGLETAEWAGPPAPVPDADVLTVTGLGLLGDLYLAADVAYVGGGFRRGRLHAAIEPAAVGVPVMAGPDLTADRDGRLLRDGGAAVPVSAAAAVARCVTGWLDDPESAARAGLAGRRTLTAGAAGREAATVLGLL